MACDIFSFFNCYIIFVPSSIATIDLLLRRTLARFVILIITFDGYHCYQLFFHSTKPTQVVLIQSFFNFAPPGRGWLTTALRFSPPAIADSHFKKCPFEKLALC